MTLDKEKLRPWFEAWYLKETEAPIGPREGDGYTWLEDDLAWSAFCAAFESLGEPVAHASSERPNALVSAAQFGSALPKNRMEYSIPLYRLPEVKE